MKINNLAKQIIQIENKVTIVSQSPLIYKLNVNDISMIKLYVDKLRHNKYTDNNYPIDYIIDKVTNIYNRNKSNWFTTEWYNTIVELCNDIRE